LNFPSRACRPHPANAVPPETPRAAAEDGAERRRRHRRHAKAAVCAAACRWSVQPPWRRRRRDGQAAQPYWRILHSSAPTVAGDWAEGSIRIQIQVSKTIQEFGKSVPVPRWPLTLYYRYKTQYRTGIVI
jgi:hypothetical protein